MNAALVFAKYLIALAERPLPTITLALLPALIAVAGAASLNARSDDRIRAWVQIISGLLLTAWMVAPWHPTDPDLISMNLTITLFAYGYVLQDWLREAWRSGLAPRWAHVLVMLCFLAVLAAMILAARHT